MHRAWILIPLALVACTDGGGDDAEDTDDADEGYVPDVPDRSAYVSCEATTDSDADDDGTIDGTILQIYDALGWVVHHEYDTSFHRIETWSGRNAWGQYERYERDDDGDGVIELRQEGAYAGHLYVWNTTDEGGDGVIEARETHTNVDGQRASTAIDEGDDGTVDVEVTYTRDSLRRVLRQDFDRALDGTIDEWFAYTYEGTADDTQDGYHEDEDGNVETWRYEYDGDHLVSYVYDAETAGWTYELQYTYEGDDIVHVDLAYTSADTSYTGFYEYVYDALGRPIESLFELTFEGAVSADLVTRETTTWSCP